MDRFVIFVMRPVHSAVISTENKNEVTAGKRNDKNKKIACNDDMIQSNWFLLTGEKNDKDYKK